MTFPTRTVVTEPIGDGIVTLAEVKDHLSLFGDTTFDNYLGRLMIVATDYVSDYIDTSLEVTTIIDYYNRFNKRLYLSEEYVDGDVLVAYFDEQDAVQSLDASEFVFDNTAQRASIYITGATPTALSRNFANPISITYDTLNTNVVDHEGIKQSILMMIGDMFTHRENQIDASLTTVNITMDRLLRPRRSNLI